MSGPVGLKQLVRDRTGDAFSGRGALSRALASHGRRRGVSRPGHAAGLILLCQINNGLKELMRGTKQRMSVFRLGLRLLKRFTKLWRKLFRAFDFLFIPLTALYEKTVM